MKEKGRENVYPNTSPSGWTADVLVRVRDDKMQFI
jgi:hypothetical protein